MKKRAEQEVEKQKKKKKDEVRSKLDGTKGE
jgi:hypothetical protein